MDIDSLYSELKKLTFSTFLFKLNPEETLILGKFYGSTLRGGLGYSFKKIACIFKDKKYCSECVLSDNCSYAILFESKLKKQNATLKASDIPRPYILDITHYKKQTYEKDEILPLKLTLIGTAIKYLPYFFLSIQILGEKGFGYQRKNFNIVSLLQEYPHYKELYNIEENTLEKPDTGFLKPRDEYRESNSITINFMSPVCLKHKGKIVSVIEFHHLIRSLIHRITFLAEHWCETKIEYDWNDRISSKIDLFEIYFFMFTPGISVYSFFSDMPFPVFL